MTKRMEWSPTDILSKQNTHDNSLIKLIAVSSQQIDNEIIVVPSSTIWMVKTRQSSSCRCLNKKDAP